MASDSIRNRRLKDTQGRPKFMTLSIDVPDNMYQALLELASELGCSVNDIFVKGCEAILAEPDERSRPTVPQ